MPARDSHKASEVPGQGKAHLGHRAVDLLPVAAVHHVGVHGGPKLPAFGCCFLNALLSLGKPEFREGRRRKHWPGSFSKDI